MNARHALGLPVGIEIVKVCSCCGVQLTAKAWAGLKALRPQRFGTYVCGMYYPDPTNPDLEMRNCICGTTLTLPLNRG